MFTYIYQINFDQKTCSYLYHYLMDASHVQHLEVL